MVFEIGTMLPKEKEIIFNVIEKYKQMPNLWDRGHINYRQREIRREGNKILLEIYKELDPHATLRTVLKKIHNLRTSFFKEYGKVKTSILVGDVVYEPTLWYYDAMSFLGSKCVYRDRSETKKTSVVKGLKQKQPEEALEQERLTGRSVDNSSSSIHIYDHAKDHIKNHIIDHMNGHRNDHKKDYITHYRNDPLQDTQMKEPLLTVPKKEIEDTFSMTRDNKTNVRRIKEDDNECELYAQLLARKLKKLEDDQRLVLMNEIDNLVFKAIMASKRKANTSVFFTMVDPNNDEDNSLS